MINSLQICKGASEAKRFLKRYFLADVFRLDMRDVAMLQNVFVKEESLSGATAYLVRGKRGGVVTIDSQVANEHRKRFSIAHELGHFNMHHEENFKYCTDEMFQQWQRNNVIEVEANDFAAELLIPSELFREYTKKQRPTRTLFQDLSAAFNVSVTALMIRYVEIGPYPSAIFACKQNRVVWTRHTDDFTKYIKRVNDELDPYSLAGEFFFTGLLEENPSQVRVDTWISDFKIAPDSYVNELAIQLPSLKMILSLVWFN